MKKFVSIILLATMMTSCNLYANVGTSSSTVSKDDWIEFGDLDDNPYKNTKNIEGLAAKTNFTEMRRGLEKLCDTTVSNGTGYGPLYTRQSQDGDIDSQNPSFQGFVGTKASQQYAAKPMMGKEMAGLASTTFNDITGKEWYASMIPMSVYYGVVNGYEDGTFRGQQSVTRAEFATMFANYDGSSNTASNRLLKTYGNTWYVNNLKELDSSPLSAYNCTKTTINSAMTRGEVAIVLAKELVPDLYAKYEKALYANSIKTFPFTDVKGYTTGVGEDLGYERIKVSQIYDTYMKKCQNTAKPPRDVLVAMLALNEAGIMTGDSNGKSNWNKGVTRAEVLAFFQKTEMGGRFLTK